MCKMIDAKNSTSTVGPHSSSAFERFVYASLTLKLLDQIRTLVQFFFPTLCSHLSIYGVRSLSFDQFRQILQTNFWMKRNLNLSQQL